MSDTFECTRTSSGDAKRGYPAFAHLRLAGTPWPPSRVVNVLQYDGAPLDISEGRRYVLTLATENGLDSESQIGVLDDVWRLSVDGEVEFHRLTRAVLRPGDGPYEITGNNEWGQRLAKALPKDHPVWQFIKVR